MVPDSTIVDVIIVLFGVNGRLTDEVVIASIPERINSVFDYFLLFPSTSKYYVYMRKLRDPNAFPKWLFVVVFPECQRAPPALALGQAHGVTLRKYLWDCPYTVKLLGWSRIRKSTGEPQFS